MKSAGVRKMRRADYEYLEFQRHLVAAITQLGVFALCDSVPFRPTNRCCYHALSWVLDLF